MARRRSHRPSDPAAIAARRAALQAAARLREAEIDRDPAAWGPNLAALDLPANHAVTAEQTGGAAARRKTCLQRRDVFDRFFAAGALKAEALDAVRRLQNDVARLHRSGAGVGPYAPRIDSSATADGFTAARHAAGRRIEEALAFAGEASGRLLLGLCDPAAALGCAADWRAAVQRHTGETLPDAQGAVLRAACGEFGTGA